VGVGRGALAIIADALDRAVALLLGAVTVDGCKPSDLIGGRWLDDRSARAPESLGCQRRILERAFRADRVSRALQRANEVRSARAKLKKELAAGTVELAQIPADPPACVRTARVPASGARQLAPPREPAPVSHRVYACGKAVESGTGDKPCVDTSTRFPGGLQNSRYACTSALSRCEPSFDTPQGFREFGINLRVLEPGQPNGLYPP
jgi:hypothetical protein